MTVLAAKINSIRLMMFEILLIRCFGFTSNNFVSGMFALQGILFPISPILVFLPGKAVAIYMPNCVLGYV